MESPRKFNDCYFYYYSTCTKGDNCVFRHEPSALGCETMCSAWQQGKCLDKRCKLRHMELRKNRKQIPCYWETQPGGCRKKHCPFMHKNPDARTDGIAPSQPAPPTPAQPVVSAAEVVESSPAPLTVSAPASQPVPLQLWQQQRQVVLDSAILGVLPASSELLGARRVLPAHAHGMPAHGLPHAHPHPHEPPNPYAPLPVDPLVVNFEEESDNESGPSSTPTKNFTSEDAHGFARSKSQELLILEKIQAEAAAMYRYDGLPPMEPINDRKIARTNLSTKYDRLSLDEISGKKQSERRSSLDFKVLSLEEIRARKKTTETTMHTAPITLNLSRKRKLSTQETVTTSGNKILKVVRSNSIVYRKIDQNAPTTSAQTKASPQSIEPEGSARKRTISEISDIYDIQDDELFDNCYEFKKVKLTEPTYKPILNRNRNISFSESRDDFASGSKTDTDSDAEVQIVSIDITDDSINQDKSLDCELITTPVAIVDLSDDLDDGFSTSDPDIDLVKNVPDVVASCQKNNVIDLEKDVLQSIDDLINDKL